VGAAAGEFAAQLEVFAVCALQGVAEYLQLLVVLLFQFGDLAGEGDDQGVVVVGGGFACDLWAGAAEVFDSLTQFGVVVEECVGYPGFALHGLKGNGLTTFDQPADGLLGVAGFALGLSFCCVG
jgi:hypothetical protein